MPQNEKQSTLQLLGPTKRAALAETLRKVATEHHQALAVEVLGEKAAGVSPREIQEMIAAGTLDPNKLGGFKVPGTNLDMFEFVARVARMLERAPISQQAQMRRWPLSKWASQVGDVAPKAPPKQAQLPSGSIRIQTPETGMGGDTPTDAIGKPIEAPSWMGPSDRAAYGQAQHRAGSFARGLGNRVGDDLEAAIAEVWEGDTISEEIRPLLRTKRVEQIREAVSGALATHRDPRKLASDLGHATGNWSHNWERVAKTELQDVLNEGTAISAVQHLGIEAQIARIPESDACEDCLRLFLDADGYPTVWKVSDLAAQGNNVGKPRAQWVATIRTVHPHCQCGTVTVPAGFYATRTGALRRVETKT